jgi:hypothetical protein
MPLGGLTGISAGAPVLVWQQWRGFGEASGPGRHRKNLPVRNCSAL